MFFLISAQQQCPSTESKDYRKAKIKTCLICELLVLHKMRNYVGQRFGGINLNTWQYIQTTWIIYVDYGIDCPA